MSSSPRIFKFNASVQLTYLSCPNGKFATIIKAKNLRYCYLRVGALPVVWGGLTQNIYLKDNSGRNVNPRPVHLEPSMHPVCTKKVKIAKSLQTWQFMTNRPVMKNRVDLTLTDYHGPEIYFYMETQQDPPERWRRINPMGDVVVKKLHRIKPGA